MAPPARQTKSPGWAVTTSPVFCSAMKLASLTLAIVQLLLEPVLAVAVLVARHTISIKKTALFHLQIQLMHQTAPFLLFLIDVGGVLCRRRSERIAALEVDPLLHLRIVGELTKFDVPFLDDVRRRALRRQQSIMQDRFETGHPGLVDGGHIREKGKASLACDCNRAQRAGLKIAQRRRQHAEGNWQMTAEQVIHNWG